MDSNPLSILQISTYDIGGGAEKVAWNLFKAYEALGHSSWLAVGRQYSNNSNIFEIPRPPQAVPWARLCWLLHGRLIRIAHRVQGIQQICAWLRTMAQGIREIERELGREDFNYSGTRQLLRLTPQLPDIIHAHNLHTDYFDLRLLPHFSRQVPLVLQLHDAWMLSGNCAHSFDCERWITGCGACPDISIYPGIRRDATAYNWRRKKNIYARSRLYISTPCHWLMNKVRNSILMAGARDCRVIPHGIDLAVFHPGDKKAARALLGMSQTAKVLLFAANGIRQNIWKDYKTLKEAVALIDNRLQGSSIVIIALGEDAPPERIGNAEICFVPPQQDPMLVAQYYQAADIYVHASRADTFPVTILEALACSTPVVATAVGGIPEQVRGLRVHFAAHEYPLFKKEQSTGILVPGGDPEALSAAISALLKDDALCRQLGEQAAHDARQCFSLERCADDYLAWYQEIIDQEKHSKK